MKFFIDFEATQFSDRIISIGCVAENGNTFNTLVKPVKETDKVSSFITKLTGITNEMLETAPTANEAFNSFFDFVINNGDNSIPEYYCYGNTDKRFIEHTVKYMTDIRAITFAESLRYTIQDYSAVVKSYFQTKNEIALRKAYILVQDEEIEQHHDALEDAQMLFTIATNMKINCNPEDAAKLAFMPKSEKPVPTSDKILKNAPQQFVNWPSDKWEADTGADETNWVVSCTAGPHIKYFDSKDTAMLWVLRYLSKGLSVKNLTHQEIVKQRLEEGYAGNKKPWSCIWTENRERIE